LAAHAQAFHDGGGADVAGVAAGGDAVQAELVEAEAEQFPGGLGGQAAAVVGGVEHEPDLAVAVGAAVPEEGEVADDDAGVGELGGEAERLALVVEGGAEDLVLEGLAG